MLFAGPMLMAASSCLTAVAQSFPELLCYRFLGGAAMEMWRQARLAIIADVSKSRQRGRQMSGMVGTEGAGRLLGPALGGMLGAWSIRMPFVVHGSAGVSRNRPELLSGSRVSADRKQRID
jgi:DHA1 family multidrug resistance protein-like MFS transporter